MKELATRPDAAAIESVLIQGDLSKLNAEQKVSYYNRLCDSLGLNSLTKPFEYLKFQGREILYARRDCADQLRSLHKVSIKITARELLGDMYIVTAQASMPDGRCDEATGVLNFKGLSGDSLANAYMKCESKAKRRVTLSICGLGLLDETEVESLSREANPAKAEQVNALLNETSVPTPAAPVDEPDFVTEAAAAEPENLGDYVIPIGQKNKGKKLSDLSPSNVADFLNWVRDNIQNKNAATLEFIEKAEAYLETVT